MKSDFKELKVWKKSVDFAVLLYRLTEKFPRREIYGLTSQIRRSAVSVSSNIAEGSGKSTSVDFRRFLHNAYGSIKETENYLILSQELGYLDAHECHEATEKCDEISRMLHGLIHHLSQSK